MRLQPERLPDAVHRRLIEADLGGHRPRRPVRRVLRRALQRLGDHLVDLGVTDRPRLPRPRLVDEPIQPLGLKPASPFRDRVAMHPEALSDLARPQPVGDQQHDLRSLRERVRSRPAPRPRLQLLTLGLGELNRHNRKRWHATTMPARTRINASGH